MRSEIDEAVEAALEVETQYLTNGSCHFGVECEDCDCFFSEDTENTLRQERDRMRHVLTAAAPILQRRTAAQIADAIETMRLEWDDEDGDSLEYDDGLRTASETARSFAVPERGTEQ